LSLFGLLENILWVTKFVQLVFQLLTGADLKRSRRHDVSRLAQKKTLGLDNTFAPDIGSDILPGMTTERVFWVSCEAPLSLRCSVWRITVQRFVHLQNLIGAHGL
jgi:hypothetical protein